MRTRSLCYLVLGLGLALGTGRASAAVHAEGGSGGEGKPPKREAGSSTENACRELNTLVSTQLYQKEPLLSLDDFRKIYQRWPEKEKKEYLAADEKKQRQLLFRYYGFVPNPAPQRGEENIPQGLTLVKDKSGKASLHANCLLCHGGQTFGEPTPGVGNPYFDFQTFLEDAIPSGDPRSLILKKRSANQVRGSVDAFSAAGFLLGLRNEKGEVPPFFQASVLSKLAKGQDLFSEIHQAFSKTPSWLSQTKYSTTSYFDASAEKDPRFWAQFMMVPSAKAAEVKASFPQLKRLNELITACQEPPKYSKAYPNRFNAAKAKEGQKAYEGCCQSCHGGIGEGGKYEYPETVLDPDLVKTDRLRAETLPPSFKKRMYQILVDKKLSDEDAAFRGYRVPSLSGVAGRPPYLHNGSVPTLRGVLDPKERPSAWAVPDVDGDHYNHRDLGLSVQVNPPLPEGASGRQKRNVYNTALTGQSNSGHDFACIQKIRETGKVDAVLEYLKTL